MRTVSRGVWVGAAGLALFLAWRAVVVNMAEFYARAPGQAAAALEWAPRHPKALFDVGNAAMAQDAGRAAELVAASLGADPTSGLAYTALSRLKEAQGDLAAAERAMETASDMAPRRNDVQMEAAAFWMRRGNMERAMRHWDVALTFGTELRPRMFPQLLKLAENPARLPAFAPLLLQPVEWWPAFFEYAAGNAERVDTLHALFSLQAQGPNTATPAALRAFLARLQREGQWVDAYFIWLNGLPKDQITMIGNLFNGGFEYRISNAGFDWIADQVPLVLVETAATHGSTGSRALHVVFRGSKTAYRHLRQHLLLPPGSYHLRGRVRPESLETAYGLQWVLRCADRNGTQLAMSERFIGSDQWRHFSVAFSVPEADCDGQVLRLELAGRAALDYEARGGIWFDDLSIEQQRLD